MRKQLLLGCGFSLISAIFSLPAYADQCSYVSKQQAINTISRLNIGDRIYLLCEPCGERVPQTVEIQNLAMEKVDYQDYWQVKVNDSGIDLAYVFVNSGVGNNPLNLAAIADCPASRVSTTIPRPASQQETEDDSDI